MTEPRPAPDQPSLPGERDAHAGRAFVLVERLLLVLVMGMTVVAAGTEVASVYQRGEINLADILLMFLYTEVIGMVAVYYTGKGTFFIYPILIAITAIARLIVLQGKDMAPENVLYEAAAILLLSVAALVLSRAKQD